MQRTYAAGALLGAPRRCTQRERRSSLARRNFSRSPAQASREIRQKENKSLKNVCFEV